MRRGVRLQLRTWDPDTLGARLAEAAVRDDEITAQGWGAEVLDAGEPESDAAAREPEA